MFYHHCEKNMSREQISFACLFVWLSSRYRQAVKTGNVSNTKGGLHSAMTIQGGNFMYCSDSQKDEVDFEIGNESIDDGGNGRAEKEEEGNGEKTGKGTVGSRVWVSWEGPGGLREPDGGERED
jgi:hypothetical protein